MMLTFFYPLCLKYPFILIITWVETLNEIHGWVMHIWLPGLLLSSFSSICANESTGLAQASHKKAKTELSSVIAY